MPKRVVSAKFIAGLTAYTMDIGQDIATTGLFNAPPDITDADIAQIVSSIGASLDGELPPCRDFVGSLRKLRFIREKGNTMSVPVSTRANLLSAATVIKGVLNAANGGNNKVVCIQLLGEEFPNLSDELGLSYTAGSFAVSHRAPSTANKQYYHAGTVGYSADSTNPLGGTIFQPVKAISNNEDAPATQLGSTWGTCVGDFVDVLSCPRPSGRKNPLKHRRFDLTFLLDNTTISQPSQLSSEKIEVPCTSSSQGNILSCGQALAALDGAYCIGYRGESYSRFHKLLP